MKISQTQKNSTVIISVLADENDFAPTVKSVYNQLRQNVSAKGFRPGKAPNEVIDKQLGADTVQNEILEALAEKAYRQALEQEDIRPISHPHVEIKKMVPYTEAELEFKVDVMPEITLADYKKLSIKPEEVEVTDEEVDGVIDSLARRMSERSAVERAAKDGDEVKFDFTGRKNGELVPGAQANDYDLVLGSGSFIPGFEEELIGLKSGDEKTFTITFPKDYGEASLAGQDVEFSVTIKQVSELKPQKIDDEFAKSSGPFDSLKAMKEDVKSHLKSEKEQQNQRQFENQIIETVVKESKLELPESILVNERQQLQQEYERQLEDQGITEEEFLKETDQTKKKLNEDLDARAEQRVKTSLVLTEVAREEGIEVSEEEFEVRMQVIAGQYQDEKIQEQLQTPGARREIHNQLLTEKTIAKLVEYTDTE